MSLLRIGPHHVILRTVRTRWYHRLWDRVFPSKPHKIDTKNTIPLGNISLNLYASYGGKVQVGIGEIVQNRPTMDSPLRATFANRSDKLERQ